MYVYVGVFGVPETRSIAVGIEERGSVRYVCMYVYVWYYNFEILLSIDQSVSAKETKRKLPRAYTRPGGAI